MHSAFEQVVLEWVAHDFEAPHTIAGDIARESGRPVTESEVRAALLNLAERGLIQAYTFDSAAQRYRPISSADARTFSDPWFMALPESHEPVE